MRLVHVSHDDPTVIELNWMWLPSFIGQNHYLMDMLQRELTQKFGGQAITDEKLDAIHCFVLNWLQAKFEIEGVREYLSGIARVKQADDEGY